MRSTQTFRFEIDLVVLEQLNQHYDTAVYLNGNKQGASFLALGVQDELVVKGQSTFNSLKQFQTKHNDWLFGYLPYDLKNEIEPQLASSNPNFIEFDETHFFVPKLVLELKGNIAQIHYLAQADVEELKGVLTSSQAQPTIKTNINLKQKVDKSTYIDHIEEVKNHIQLGNIYEMNYCHEFYGSNVELSPVNVYGKLNELTKAPFSTFYKNKEQYILSGSPERFLKKEGDKIISQPIKGTAKRGKTSKEDELIKHTLANDPKERAENIMIVDLVRNDLSKTAAKGSVNVEELCRVYSFNTVHQMISTVTSELKADKTGIDVLATTFPMGSMTGAPKIAAMQIIEKLEQSKRGVYSGAIGYFTPTGDFDFNVVIRSILYNKQSKKCSFMVGGAITLKSNPEKEYEETLLKAEALIKALSNES